MRHGSLFSGIGGFDLAAEWMGWENVFHCEWNEFGKKILNYYWPNAESFDDITKTDFTKYANKIDILTGGFPCQPYSMAGKRKGKEDERHLWPQMLRAIREIKPKYIVGENVFGLLNWNGGLVFDEVHTDLELEGYEVQAVVIPAAAVNAPHGRDRVWFVAYSSCNANGLRTKGGMGMDGEILERRKGQKKANRFNDNCENGDVADTSSIRFCQHREGQRLFSATLGTSVGMGQQNVTDSYCIGCRGRNKQSKSNQSKEWQICKNEQYNGNGIWCKVEGCSGNVTDTKCDGLQHGNKTRNIRSKEEATRRKGGKLTNVFKTDGQNEYATDSDAWRLQRWNDKKKNKQSVDRNTWDIFPTQSPICGGDDGIPTELDGITFSKWRKESIMGYGNAIVPQVAYEIFKVLQHIDDTLK